MQEHSRAVALAGSALIALYGLSFFRKKSEPKIRAGQAAASCAADFLSALGIALLNPTAVLSFLAVFSAFGVGDCTAAEGVYLELGLLSGTGFWWLLLSGAAEFFKKKIDGRIYLRINRALGIVMLVLAAALCAVNL